MTRTTGRFVLIPALLTWLAVVPSARVTAAPPLIEGIGQYRIVDAAGNIAPRTVSDVAGRRVALRPAVPPPLIFRQRPLRLSGYAGATYPPIRSGGRLNPTGYHSSHWFAPFWHGD